MRRGCSVNNFLLLQRGVGGGGGEVAYLRGGFNRGFKLCF